MHIKRKNYEKRTYAHQIIFLLESYECSIYAQNVAGALSCTLLNAPFFYFYPTVCSQFHQHLTSSFCANIFAPKKLKTNCEKRKAELLKWTPLNLSNWDWQHVRYLPNTIIQKSRKYFEHKYTDKKVGQKSRTKQLLKYVGIIDPNMLTPKNYKAKT